MEERVALAVRKCPFLHELASRHGDVYARNIALNPTKPASKTTPCPILEESSDFDLTFQLFHGPLGVVPLAQPEQTATVTRGCPFASHKLQNAQQPEAKSHADCVMALPLASMSFSLGNGFGDFLRNKFGHNKHKPPRRINTDKGSGRQPQKPGPSSSGSGVNRAQSSSNINKPQRPSAASNFTSSSSNTGGLTGPSSSAGGAAGHSSHGNAASGGGCPLRKWLGPYAGLIFNKNDQLQCPPAIVQARAALARTQAVRTLRPQALPIKLLAVVATTAALNVPCGAVREHFEKFSLGWIVAVHATIPFIAMLRKAVIMPKYAILFTIASAVGGQMVGSRMERRRLAAAAAVARDADAQAVMAGEGRRPVVAKLVCKEAKVAATDCPKAVFASLTSAAMPKQRRQQRQQQQEEEWAQELGGVQAVVGSGQQWLGHVGSRCQTVAGAGVWEFGGVSGSGAGALLLDGLSAVSITS